MSLILISQMKQDESGLGFYRRVAESNRMSSVSEMMDAMGWVGGQKALFQSPESVSKHFGLDKACTTLASSHFASSREFGTFYRRNSDAICPVCIDESVHLRRHWDHGLFTACVAHKCKLLDSCPQCLNSLSKTRESIDACDCGFQLRHSETREASKSEIWVSCLIANGSASVTGYLPVKKPVRTNTAANLIRVLATGADTTVPFRMRSTSSGFTGVLQAVELIKRIEPLVSNWPEGFRQHVEERIECGAPDGKPPANPSCFELLVFG